MPSYYVNKNAQPNGDHEVHVEGCVRLPEPGKRQYLGEFTNCRPAVEVGRGYFHQLNGCAHCCPDCNTG
jgi:hypothetical protein